MIALEGTLRNNHFQDKKYPDITHYNTDVLVENVEFCGDKGSNGSSTQPPSAPPQQQTTSNSSSVSYSSLNDYEEILSDGDVPF